MGFDIGAILANLILSYFSQDGHGTNNSRKEYKVWLIEQVERNILFTYLKIESIWNLFQAKFIGLWNTEHKGDVFSPLFLGEEATTKAQKQYMRRLLGESMAFAAAKMIRYLQFYFSNIPRRIVGVAHVADLESISNNEMKVKCERNALVFAKYLIVNSESFSRIEDVTSKLAEY